MFEINFEKLFPYYFSTENLPPGHSFVFFDLVNLMKNEKNIVDFRNSN